MMAAEDDPHGFLEDSPFDTFEEALRQPSTTPDEERGVCPECDSTNLRYRPGATIAANPHHHGGTLYKCRTCEAEFDEPEGGR